MDWFLYDNGGRYHTEGLRVRINLKLNFDDHVSWASPYMDYRKMENYFSNAKFNYCPLILKLHSCNINNVIRNLYESGLQLNFSDKNSSYEELLLKYGSVSIPHKNIQILMIEMQMSQE